MRTRPHVFNERNDKMIEAVLNAHKDSQKEVKMLLALQQVSERSDLIVSPLVFVSSAQSSFTFCCVQIYP